MTKIITIQPAQVQDATSPDGSPLYRLPYPFHVDAETGDVGRQDFWRGDPQRVIGFQDDVDVQRVNLWWDEAAADPDKIVGKFPVMVGPSGIYTYTVAIDSVAITKEV